MRARWRARLLVAGWALLLCAWTIGNPPFAAPDEAAHYVRAIGLGSGHLAGRPTPPGSAPGATPAQTAWVDQADRRVAVPAGLAPPADCYVHDPSTSAACLAHQPRPPAVDADTPVGTYPPLPYVLPAAALRLGSDAQDALRWGRAAGALLALLLLGLGVVAVRDPEGDVRAVLGPLAAVTPMAIFCGASLTGSGLEVASAVAFACALLRLTRAPGAAPTWVWALAGVAGAALSLSRSASPVWTIAIGALVVSLAGAGRLRADARPARRPARLTAAALVAGVVLNRVWEAAYGASVPVATRAIPLGVERAIQQWWHAARELVGGFGYLELRLPAWLALLWLAVVAGLLVPAWRAGDRRQRRALTAAVTLVVVLPIALYLVVLRGTGFGLQGRHVLPLAVVLPLLAGEVVHRRRIRLPAAVPPLMGAGVGLVQLAAFWLDARRSAVGVHGPLLFVGHAQWSPPLGWPIVLALATAGAVALAAVTAPERAPARRRPPRPSTTRSRWPRAAGPARTRARR